MTTWDFCTLCLLLSPFLVVIQQLSASTLRVTILLYLADPVRPTPFASSDQSGAGGQTSNKALPPGTLENPFITHIQQEVYTIALTIIPRAQSQEPS